jgi:hypothetical protein
VGGFDEEFVAEDVAITLRLMRAGWLSKLVNLRSYDAEPGDIFSFAKRQIRWAKQTIQIQWAPRERLPFCVQVQMFRLAWMYLGTFLYPMWALLTAWGARSTLKDAHAILSALLAGSPGGIRGLTPFCVSLLLPLGLLLAKLPFLRAARVPLREFIPHVLLSWAITFYLMFAVCRAQLNTILGSAVQFDVTRKRFRRVTMSSILLNYPGLWLFLLAVSVGLLGNPLALFLAAPWWCVMVFSPVIIFVAHGPKKQLPIMEHSLP